MSSPHLAANVSPTNGRLRHFLNRLGRFGPGIYCLGYTIGTGSVTTMATAGASSGMTLLWVLALSCIFSALMVELSGRLAAGSGRTLLHTVRSEMPGGTFLSWLILGGVALAQWSAITGILGLCSNLAYQVLRISLPELPAESRLGPFVIAVCAISVIYSLILVGRYGFFEKVLIAMVTTMVLGFFAVVILVPPPVAQIAKGFSFQLPPGPNALLMAVAFVGTTMAAATFVARPLIVLGKGWCLADLKTQRRDAIFSGTVMFLVSAAVMAVATSALFMHGKEIRNVIDMLGLLEPLAGRVGAMLFAIGALSAGLSSIFPIAMILPMMLADREAGKLDTRSPRFRILCGLACLFGLLVPALGFNPIAAQIATQIVGVFILPLTVLCLAYLVNQRRILGDNRAGWAANIGLSLAFLFACAASFAGLRTLWSYFTAS